MLEGAPQEWWDKLNMCIISWVLKRKSNVKNNSDSQEGHANGNNLPLKFISKIYSRHSMHHRNSTKSLKKSIISFFIIKPVFSQADDFLSQGNNSQALASHSIFVRIPALPTLLRLGLLEDQMRFGLLRCFKKKNFNYHVDGK